LPWTDGSVANAGDNGPVVRDHHDPIARVQVLLKSVTIHNDRDWGDGEIKLSAGVWAYSKDCPPGHASQCSWTLAEATIPEFSATDGQVKVLNRLLPSAGDRILDSTVGQDIGIPIVAGQTYGFGMRGVEDDPTDDDVLGSLGAHIAAENGSIQFGTHHVRGWDSCPDRPYFIDFCGPNQPSDFSLEYEIRKAPIADLRPTGLSIADLLGRYTKLFCMPVENVGESHADSFKMALRIDGVVPADGRASVGGLTPGASTEACTEILLPAAGEHELAVIADESGAVVEYNETNNVYVRPVASRKPAGTGSILETTGNSTDAVVNSAPVPAPALSPVSTDLIVTAIKVNGQIPDGKDDCKTGKNVVTAAFRNGGSAKAEGFAVRLTVDGASAGEQTVNGLEAGQEQEVRFADLQLKKGEHTLTLTVDSKDSIAESSEQNNERTVSAICKDGG
jgi:hypothetical protein